MIELEGHSTRQGPFSRTTDTTDEAVAQAYYNLITDANVARAHVVAKTAYDAAPDDASRRLTHAFSLWKQKRASEANALLAGHEGKLESDLVPVALLRAAIHLDLNQIEEAQAAVKSFKLETALPEEAALERFK